MIKEPVKPLILISVLSAVSLLAVYNIAAAWQAGDLEIKTVFSNFTSSTVARPEGKQKPPKIVAKGLYLTAYSAGSSKKIDEIISLLNRTELNSVVIDIKDYSGLVLYDSKLHVVSKYRLKDNRYPDIKATIKKLHDNNIYVIGRQTVFQDPVLAERKTEWALRNKNGALWRDYKGLAWVDPTMKEVWDYNIEIAKEAISFGFDEINFDYVRFPSDGNLKNVVYANTTTKKYENMAKFYEYLGNQLKSEPAWISLDLFGFVMEKKGEDDMNIGQRLVDSVDAVDYIYPMMYPSHYPPGHLGLSNPAAHPRIVIDNGMKKGVPVFEGKRAKVRPWIQAFNMGANYDSGYNIREQIDALEKYDNAGWFLWNAANRYSSAGLKLE